MRRRSMVKWGSLAAPVMLLAAGLSSAGSSAAAAPDDDAGQKAPEFSISALAGERTVDVTGVNERSAAGKALAEQDLSVSRAESGEEAIVDRSAAKQGIIAAYGASFVDLSWKAYAANARYVVFRDDARIASLEPGVTSFRDRGVKSGAEYNYRVMPVLPEEGDHSGSRVWGIHASVPDSRSTAGLRREAVSQANAVAAWKSTSINWEAFIPQKKIDAPPVGCDYGKGYQFGGDGRGFGDGWPYRVSLSAGIGWDEQPGGITDAIFVGSSHVYRKGENEAEEVRKASREGNEVRRLGGDKNSVDIRFVMHASNPFCKGLGGVKGAIDGALTLNMTKSGHWAIRSGNHRQMPNHEISWYSNTEAGSDGSGTIYTREYANTACLIGSAVCPVADLTGLYG